MSPVETAEEIRRWGPFMGPELVPLLPLSPPLLDMVLFAELMVGLIADGREGVVVRLAMEPNDGDLETLLDIPRTP